MPPKPKTAIAKQRAKIEQRLKEHDAARKIIEAELLSLQHACPHKNVRQWTHHDYGGGSDRHWNCDDCGLHKIT